MDIYLGSEFHQKNSFRSDKKTIIERGEKK